MHGLPLGVRAVQRHKVRPFANRYTVTDFDTKFSILATMRRETATKILETPGSLGWE